MQHHDYPMPPKEIWDRILEARRTGVSEEKIAAELRGRGLDEQAVAAALAPGAVVCAIAESGPDMINHHSHGQMLAYGLIFGLPSAWLMARTNSIELWGQDRMGRKLPLLLALWAAVAAILVVGGIPLGWSIHPYPTWLPRLFAVVYVVANAVLTWIFVSMARHVQRPFHADAERRDELAPASVMVPLLVGIFHVVTVAVFVLLWTVAAYAN